MGDIKTFGQLLVNRLFPEDMQEDGQLTKSKLHNKLRTMAKRDMDDAAPRIEALRRLGHELATTEGVSASLADITPDYATRKRVLQPVLRQMQNTDDVYKRRELLNKAHPDMMEASKTHPGTFGEMVRSGARGKPVQLMKNVSAPVMALEGSGDPYPWLIHHSYAEGLRNSEMWAANVETRNNQIDTRLAVTEPGDLSKILVNNMTDQLVLTEDCGTRNGVVMLTSDPHIVDRFLAKSAGGFPANTLVTPTVLTSLNKKKVGQVIVRSPMTCEAADGVCQKCYGLDHRGQLQTLGNNVGVMSAQALSEPLTQFALSAKHGVRTTTQDKATVSGHKGLRRLLDVPESFPNEAAMSPVDGVVDSVEDAPQGGRFVTVSGERVYASPGMDAVVRAGDKVYAGDVLSEGVVNPANLVRYKGLGEGRKYMADTLHNIYKNQGLDVDKRHLEILARSHLNYVRVDDDPEGRYYPGEVVSYNNLVRDLADSAEDTDLDEAEGKVLAKPQLHYSAGTRVTPRVTAGLRAAGLKSVFVVPQAPTLTPIMKPITRNLLMNPDWMARLGGRELRKSLQEGAAFGEKSDIHGAHPIPAYAFGSEFGQDPKGKY